MTVEIVALLMVKEYVVFFMMKKQQGQAKMLSNIPFWKSKV